MNISREEKKEEALKRMEAIAEHFNLGEKLVNYLKEDKLYYSYAYSMDTINYDERYIKIVQDFESKNNAYVYHAVEAKTNDGYTLLSLLFVGDHEEDWITERLEGNSIFTFTICVEEPAYSAFGEFGWIIMDSPLGYLMRTA